MTSLPNLILTNIFFLSEIHDTVHFGVDKTYALLKDRSFLTKHVCILQDVVSTYLIYQQTKINTAPPKATLLSMAIPNAPVEFIVLLLPLWKETAMGMNISFSFL